MTTSSTTTTTMHQRQSPRRLTMMIQMILFLIVMIMILFVALASEFYGDGIRILVASSSSDTVITVTSDDHSHNQSTNPISSSSNHHTPQQHEHHDENGDNRINESRKYEEKYDSDSANEDVDEDDRDDDYHHYRSNRHDLPHLILHVGPPKTASTTLQETMKQWQSILWEKGRCIYLGKRWNKKRSTNFKPSSLSLFHKDRPTMSTTITTDENDDAATTTSSTTTLTQQVDDDIEDDSDKVHRDRLHHHRRRSLLRYSLSRGKKHLRRHRQNEKWKEISNRFRTNDNTMMNDTALYEMTDYDDMNHIINTIRNRQCHEEMSIVREQYYYCIHHYQHNINNNTTTTYEPPRYNTNNNTNDHDDDDNDYANGSDDDDNGNDDDDNNQRYRHNVNCTKLLESIQKHSADPILDETMHDDEEMVLLVSSSPFRFLYYELIQIPCARRIIEVLRLYSYYRIHLLYSDELMSRGGERYMKYHTIYDTVPSHYDYISLSALLMPYYQLSIVVSYRRYYEWYLSAKQQQERYVKHRYHYNSWPSSSTASSISSISSIISSYQHQDNNTSTIATNDRSNHTNLNATTNRHDGWNVAASLMKMNNSASMIFDDTGDDDEIINHMNNTSSSDNNNNRYESPRGIVMEPLFPNYWKTVVPGHVVIYDDDRNLCLLPYQHRKNIPIDTYWANTIGIPMHYTHFMYRGMIEQRRLLNNHYAIHSNDTIMSDIMNNETTTTGYSNDNTAFVTNSDRPLLNVVLLNLHELLDVNNYTKPLHRTLFVCRVIPHAKKLCQYSKQVDMLADDPMNHLHYKLSDDYSTYDQLVTAAYLTGRMKDEYVYSGRHQTILSAKRYHESMKQRYEEQKQVGENGTNDDDNNNQSPYDFPLLCPTHDDLEEFLNQSLWYESILLPKFYDSSIMGKERHIHDFWYDAKERSKFCWIDTNQTLQQTYWKDFFFLES